MRVAALQNSKSRFALFLIFHAIWGIFLGWSISRYSLATSRDSAEYLLTSLNLAKGNGFISFSGAPYILWPPLYPMLLALIQRMSGVSPLEAASVLQWITWGWISVLISWFFTKVFPDNFVLAFMGNAIAGTGVALTMLFQSAGSDYLFIALILSFVYWANDYIAFNRIQTLWMMTLFSALAMLQRYLGISALVTGGLIVYFYSKLDFRERLKRSAILGLSVVPVGIWVLSVSLDSLERSGPAPLTENLYWFSLSSLNWFFPYSTLGSHPFRTSIGLWGIWLVTIASAFVILILRKRYSPSARIETPVLLFGLVYTIILLTIATLSFFNRLDGRFVAPLYISFVLLLMVALETVMKANPVRNNLGRLASGVFVGLTLVILLGLSVFRSIESINEHYEAGWGYTSKQWYENKALKYWLQHQPEEDFVVFSNYPSGVALHSWMVTHPSPRRMDPNAKDIENYPIQETSAALFEAEKTSYLIWIEPNTYTHVYTVEELRQIVAMEILYESDDGGVYKLLPLK
jgi:hypothetical protein